MLESNGDANIEVFGLVSIFSVPPGSRSWNVVSADKTSDELVSN